MKLEIQDKDFFWLVGILEGEGSFCAATPSSPNCPVISLQMTDKDIVERVSIILNCSVFFIKSKNLKHKDSYCLKVRGSKAVYFMRKFYPFMGIRRKQQITKALASFDENDFNEKYKKLQKFGEKETEEARIKITNGMSIRKAAKELGVDHETLRQRLLGKSKSRRSQWLEISF